MARSIRVATAANEKIAGAVASFAAPAASGAWPRLRHDKSGATLAIVALAGSMLLGFTALGTEMGLWYVNHRLIQNAADSAAMSAQTALFTSDGNYVAEAKAAAARYGFVDRQGGVTVAVNKPPQFGASKGNTDDVEVIVTKPQPLLFSALFLNTAPTQSARSVAQVGSNGNGCVVTLDKGSVVDLFQNGNTVLNLVHCDLYVNSNASDALDQVGNATMNAHTAYVVGGITDTARASLHTTTGPFTGTAPINDPYANVQPPSASGACSTDSTGHTPGRYCNGWNPTSGTLQPGVYVVQGGCACLAGNTTITGNGVTIFLTGSGTNWATMSVTGNANLTLTPPDSGSTAGISIFQDRNAPINISPSANLIGGNGTLNITGVVYFPNQGVKWNGNTSATDTTDTCLQIVAYTLSFVGNSKFGNHCVGTSGARNIANIGAIPARLVE